MKVGEKNIRSCPLCSGKADTISFPYKTVFNEVEFSYIRCAECFTVYVDPVPDADTISMMYSKNVYHDGHYIGIDSEPYRESANLLSKYLPEGSLVLDYGCGLGLFLKSIADLGYVPYGVEYDNDAAIYAGQFAECRALPLKDFESLKNKPVFDCVHLGDVLEHLPYPRQTIDQLLQLIRPGGLLFVEGPLEINPSIVHYFSSLYGYIKSRMRISVTNNHAPTHLFRTGAKQQRRFLDSIDADIECRHWQVYETGWPYKDCYTDTGVVKRMIAEISILMGGAPFFGEVFWNRFRGIFVKL